MRNKKTPNEIICKNNICEIVIYNKNCEEVARTIIDKDDLAKVKGYKICSSNGYALTKNNKRMHHLILPRKKGLITDHINGDKLDNRKCNLRYATYQENNRNRRNVRGYSWHKNYKKWYAQIKVNKKNIYLGCFITEKDAKNTYQEAREKYFGEFIFKE